MIPYYWTYRAQTMHAYISYLIIAARSLVFFWYKCTHDLVSILDISLTTIWYYVFDQFHYTNPSRYEPTGSCNRLSSFTIYSIMYILLCCAIVIQGKMYSLWTFIWMVSDCRLFFQYTVFRRRNPRKFCMWRTLRGRKIEIFFLPRSSV